MKSSSNEASLPSITSTATMCLQQERHHRRMSPEHPPEASSSVAASNHSNTSDRMMMPMKPIILSRKRRPGSGGIDRKKLTELLNEALTISMNFDLTSTTSSTGNDADTNVNDMTIKK